VQCNSARGWPDRAWLLLVAELVPHLRTLHLHGHMVGDRQAWAVLPHLSHLTDLRAEDLLSNETSGAVHVAQCSALRRLHLIGIHGSLNAPILTAPNLQGLQHLTLDVLCASRCLSPLSFYLPRAATNQTGYLTHFKFQSIKNYTRHI